MPVIIRNEEPADQYAIHDLTRRAFLRMPYADGDEQDVIDRLRRTGALALSLVAEEDGCVIGQVTFSPAIAPGAAQGWYTLGPVSVDPDRQKQGIGAGLIEAGLEHLRAIKAEGCILVGNPAYYARFGFRVSPQHAPADGHEHFFQLLAFGDTVPAGTFAYDPAFFA